MGIFNDIKKIFWANKAIAKNAANKASEAAKEAGDEFVEHAKEKASDLTDKLKETKDEALDKAQDFTENVGSTILTAGNALKEKAQDMTEDLGAKILGKEREETVIDDGRDVLDDILKERNIEIEEPEESIFVDPNAPKKGAIDTGLDAAANLGSKAKEKAGEVLDSIKNKAAEVSDKIEHNPAVQKAAEVSEKVGDKVLDTGEQFMEKLGEVSEKVGGEVLEKGGAALDKFGEVASDVGEKIIKAKDDLIAKAEAEAAKEGGETSDSILDKARELNQKLEDKITGKIDFDKDFADTPIDTGGSELDKHGSFWDKAAKYADGNYSMKDQEPERPEGELTIQENPDYQPKLKEGNTKGFDDLDGDGDDLIDDAIIEED